MRKMKRTQLKKRKEKIELMKKDVSRIKMRKRRRGWGRGGAGRGRVGAD